MWRKQHYVSMFILWNEYFELSIIFACSTLLATSACEAVDNVSNVITNLLKVQTKMEVLSEKLSALKTSEAEKTPSSWITTI